MKLDFTNANLGEIFTDDAAPSEICADVVFPPDVESAVLKFEITDRIPECELHDDHSEIQLQIIYNTETEEAELYAQPYLPYGVTVTPSYPVPLDENELKSLMAFCSREDVRTELKGAAKEMPIETE